MKRSISNAGIIHFVGIGGIGMSGIADVLINLGYKVRGSDLKENSMTTRLTRKGVPIVIGHDAKNVHGAAVVVISSAISKDNPEILEARRLHIPVVKRAEMLAELMKMKDSVAVAGTHGKTTTTSIVAAILDQAGMDPTVVNGGVINAYNSNARLGTGDWIVVEADESDGSFTRLTSTIAIITNIDPDHIDNFRDFSELHEMFVKFIENVPFYGVAILCIDHPEVAKLAKSTLDRRVTTYGFSQIADVSCKDVSLCCNGAEFTVVFSEKIVKRYNLRDKNWKSLALPMFGKHNVQNALAAVSVAIELGISEEDVRLAFAAFSGVKRRFTQIGEVNGVTIIDDYGHHPVEIAAVLKAARTVCKGRVYAIVQPHRYTRLKNFLEDFAKVLELSDETFVIPIYSAGEANNGIDHFTLLKKIRENGVIQADFSQNIETLASKISQKLQAGDFVIFLGAGDITYWAQAFPKALEEITRPKNFSTPI